MYKIIPAENFVTSLWKNGKGETTELAINQGGTLTEFDWRLSMATVSEDGVFSDFSGHLRNLVLIEGEGLSLVHDNGVTDQLNRHLDFATFSGSNITDGRLNNGTIKDFNIITREDKFDVVVETFVEPTTEKRSINGLTFIYCLHQNGFDLKLEKLDETIHILHGDLIQINTSETIEFSGQELILVQLKEKQEQG